jgi:hypothetical protein
VVTTLTFADASGTNAGFSYPSGVAVDASGNLFVADFTKHLIRKVTADGGMQIGPVNLLAIFVDSHVGAGVRGPWVVLSMLSAFVPIPRVLSHMSTSFFLYALMCWAESNSCA